MAVSPLWIISCASNPSTSGMDREPVSKQTAASTEQALAASFNAERRKAGKSEVPVSDRLSDLAREDSSTAAGSGKLQDNTSRLQSKSFFETMGKLQANMKDRGPETGVSFVKFWAQGNRKMLLDDWNKMGIGVSKSADGRLFAVVLLGRMGGGEMIMNPGIAPGGFTRR